MRSMTGFGRSLVHAEGLTVQVELSAVNRKQLDVAVSLPRELTALEARCQSFLGKKLHRGRIQARVLVESDLTEGGWVLDQAAAADVLRQVNEFAVEHDLKPLRHVRDLPGWNQFLNRKEVVTDLDRTAPVVEQALEEAAGELIQMRETEGAHLRQVLASLVDRQSELLEQVKAMLPVAREALEQRLRNSLNSLGDAPADVEPRLLQEIALYAEKSDIREECDRLRGHVDQFREKCAATEPVGRALDFLCQEMAREWNTLGVKASRAEIIHCALQGKEVVDKLREQVQNVE